MCAPRNEPWKRSGRSIRGSLSKARSDARALTTPEEAAQFVAATGVNVLAPAVGNMHGLLRSMVRGEVHKRLDIDRIAAIKKALPEAVSRVKTVVRERLRLFNAL